MSSYELIYIKRTSEPPDDAWALRSNGYSEDYIPTLDSWIEIIRGENHLDIAPAVPIGLLIDVTALPEPTTLLLALLAMTAVPLRVRHG